MSRTAARLGSSKTSAFISGSSSLIDQDLELGCATGGERRKRVRRLVEADRARDDVLDRELPGRDLRRNPVEVVDPVAPSADNREVVERPEHRLDRRLADEHPGLSEGAAAAERTDSRVEAGGVAGALDRDIDAQPL